MCESCDSWTFLCICSCVCVFMNTRACGCTMCKDMCLGYLPMRPITWPVGIGNLPFCATPLNYNWCILPHQYQSLKFFLKFSFLFSLFYVYGCFAFTCAYHHMVPGNHRFWKRVWNPLELELQRVVSCLRELGSKPRFSVRGASGLELLSHLSRPHSPHLMSVMGIKQTQILMLAHHVLFWPTSSLSSASVLLTRACWLCSTDKFEAWRLIIFFSHWLKKS